MFARRPHPLAERLVNRTGGASVRGQVVSAHTTADSVQLQASEFDAFGVMLETGVPDGAYCWVQLHRMLTHTSKKSGIAFNRLPQELTY